LKSPTPLSRFLPPDFDPARPIGIVAGRGVYPKLLADAARAAGAETRLLAFRDETMPELYDAFPPEHRDWFDVGQLGKWLKAFERFGCGYCVMAGQIRPRRLFDGLKPDLKAASLLFKLKRRNAETIFSAIAREIEALGVRQLDARCFLDDHVAEAGWMTRPFRKIEETHLLHGIEIAEEIARLDIGQSAVVSKGTVLAVEAFEGTDPMLRRAGGFKADPAIFVKTVKREQDYRFDVPVFGLRTLEVMREAAIACALLKAGGVLILDKPQTLAAAAKARIQIRGF